MDYCHKKMLIIAIQGGLLMPCLSSSPFKGKMLTAPSCHYPSIKLRVLKYSRGRNHIVQRGIWFIPQDPFIR